MKKFILIFFAIVFVFTANATVIFTSSTLPGLTMGDYYFVDMNGDGINDYLITVLSSSYGTIKIKGMNGNKIETGGDGKAIGLNINAPVGNNSWEDSATIYSFGGGIYYFPKNVFSYLGLKFMKSGQTYYGYFKMEVSGNGSLNLVGFDGYAYENIPNLGILAGAITSLGIYDNPFPNINWTFKPNEIIVDISNNSHEKSVELIDIQGKSILTKPLGLGTNEIDLYHIKSAIYLVFITEANKKYFVRKIYKE